MKITIINQHTNNFGDEAAGSALVNILLKKYEKATIHIIYNGDGTINLKDKRVVHETDCKLKYMGVGNILKKMIFHSYHGNKTMKQFDDLIRTSDYIFVAPCGANIGIYKDWRFLVRLLFVVFNNKKPIFYLNTIGKSGNFIFDTISKYVLEHSNIYVREQASKDYLESINISSELGIDTAFLLEYSENDLSIENRITFVPSDITDHANFKKIDGIEFIKSNILPTLCMFAKDHDMNIHILPHLNTETENRFIDELINYTKNNLHFKKIYKEKVYKLEDYCSNISNSKIVVGMRYHAIVLAAKFNVPFVSLAYENKMCEVSKYTEMSDYNIKLYQNFSKDKFSFLLEKALKNNKNINKKLKDVNKKIKGLALLPLKEIKDEK